MTVTADLAPKWDMYDREIYASPYEMYARLRDEAPLYYNEEYNFYALSRHEDVARVLGDRETFISGKGMVYNIITSGKPLPRGLFIGEDPPSHTVHRAIVSRMFTPRAVGGLETEIRRRCEAIADDLVGRSRFDFAEDFSTKLPIQVIGMLVGVPEADQPELLALFQQAMHAGTVERDEQKKMEGAIELAVWFNEYLDWREKNPTDDVMTQLLTHEFEDELGEMRTLRRDEIIVYLMLITGAGSDTTATALAWMGSLLSDHPDQRAALVADPSLVPGAVEESLRFEPPSYHFCRWSTKPTEFHGQTLPADSIVVVVPGAANRDPRKWGPTADQFDIRRTPGQIMTFSFGSHFCLGANLAKIEARLAIETLLARIPEWEVDYDAAAYLSGIDTRGWAQLPVNV